MRQPAIPSNLLFGCINDAGGIVLDDIVFDAIVFDAIVFDAIVLES